MADEDYEIILSPEEEREVAMNSIKRFLEKHQIVVSGFDSYPSETLHKIYDVLLSKTESIPTDYNCVEAVFFDGLYHMYEMKDVEHAQELFKIARNHGSSHAWRFLGMLSKDELCQEIAFLTAIDLGCKDAIRNLGNLYINQKKYDKAETCLMVAYQNGDKLVAMQLGKLDVSCGNILHAESYYLEAVDNYEAGYAYIHDAYNQLATFYFNQENWQSAEKYWLKLYAILPTSENALKLGKLYKEIGDIDNALKYYMLANNAIGCNNAGNIYHIQNKRDEAIAMWKHACVGNCMEAELNLGTVLFDSGKCDEAFIHLHNAYQNGMEDAWKPLFKCLKIRKNKPINSDDLQTVSKIFDGIRRCVENSNILDVVSLLVDINKTNSCAKRLFVKLHNKICDSLDAETVLKIGKYFLHEHNIPFAEKYFLQSLNMGCHRASYELGEMYRGREPIISKKYYVDACKNGVVEAIDALNCIINPLQLYVLCCNCDIPKYVEKVQQLKSRPDVANHIKRKTSKYAVIGECVVCANDNVLLVPRECTHAFCDECCANYGTCPHCRL
jgi:tetratricopeptide (TPR) repeat protein